MKTKSSRNLLLVTIVALLLTLVCGIFAGCKVDKDKNGKDDRDESCGKYHVFVSEKPRLHDETITISNVKDEFTGTLEGSIYSLPYDETLYFDSQTVHISEFKGNLWQGWVQCTDGTWYRIYFNRSGLGSYLGTGSFNINLGADIKDYGGDVGFGGSWTYSVYNEYGRILYCMVDGYTYTKR